MQAFNVQSLSWVVSGEAGKLPLGKTQVGSTFSALFSQVSQEESIVDDQESETPQPSESETPDEIVFDPVLTTPLSQVDKISVQSPNKLSVSGKEMHVLNASDLAGKAHGSITIEEAPSANSVRITPPEPGQETAPTTMKNQTLWIVVESKTGNPESPQASSENLAKRLPPIPEKSGLVASSLPQASSVPVVISPVPPKSQI